MNTLQTIPLYGPLSDNDSGGNGGGGGNTDQTDWKSKYDTLQAQISSGQYVVKESYIALQRNLETAVNERKAKETEIGNLQAKIAVYSSNEEELKKAVADAKNLHASTEEKLSRTQKKVERHSVIFKQFPELAPFEADGLIPEPAEGQKLEDVLTAFSTKLSSITDGALKSRAQNTTNPPQKQDDTTKKSSSAKFEEAKKALAEGKVSEYQTLMGEYHSLKKTETQ